MGKLINGKELASNIKGDIVKFVDERLEKGMSVPKVASILVGDDGGSIFYLNSQERVAKSLKIEFERVELEKSVSQEKLIDKIRELNEDESITGIILQLPLPKSMDEKEVISEISSKKDIDCLTYENQGRLYMGEKGFVPCTPNSVLTILKSLDMKLDGLEVVVLGRSNIVGKPVSTLMLKENCTVTVCHSKTKNLRDVCRRADILIVAIGKAKFIDSSYIKDGTVVIDVGTSSVDGKICGDVNTESALEKAEFITPVPGGVGAMTTTLLMKNVCEALINNEN